MPQLEIMFGTYVLQTHCRLGICNTEFKVHDIFWTTLQLLTEQRDKEGGMAGGLAGEVET